MDLASAVEPGGLALCQPDRAFDFLLPEQENCGENSASTLTVPGRDPSSCLCDPCFLFLPSTKLPQPPK